MIKEMDRAAILHIPLSQYAFAMAEQELTIRLRAKKGDLDKCTLYYGDRVCRTTPIKFTPAHMKVSATDEYFDYYEVQIHPDYCRVCYYFKLEKGVEWVYYYGDHFTHSMPDKWVDGIAVDGRSQYYQYPFILRDEIPDVPKWFQEAVVYNIFPDSFANGRRSLDITPKQIPLGQGLISKNRLGGTIRGITQNLDYIHSMGFNCLYLNPIFTAGEYHKYDLLDYYHIDPCLGTDEDFKELVENLHSRGMRIIIDGVFNHCSWHFFAFEDVVEKGEKSRYKDWFYQLQFPVKRPEGSKEIPQYMCFAYERKMPKLNTSNKEVQEYFARVGAYWVSEYHVDGWRLDVANEISREFWRSFRHAVKTENEQAVLIGEVWENAETWLKGDAFDSTMNYEFRRICGEFLWDKRPDGMKAAYQFEKMRLRYPENIARGQMNLLNSHDVPRFLSMCPRTQGRWKIACILLMLMPGVPSLFYGDELEAEGVLEEEYRRAMPWEKQKSLFGFIKKLVEIRKEYAGSQTDYQPMWEAVKGGVFAFSRNGGKGTLSVVVNAGEEALPWYIGKGKVLLCSQEQMGLIPAMGYVIYLKLKKGF